MKKTTIHKGFFELQLVETPHGPREVVLATDSVCALFYFRDLRQILLIEQPRLAVMNAANPQGLLLETIAGRFDINLGVKALVVKEAKEEIGAVIAEADVEILNDGEPMYVSAGMTNEKSYLAYVETTSDKIEKQERVFGVAAEGEAIKRVWIPRDRFISESFICQDGRLFALREWFIRTKTGRSKKKHEREK